MTTLTITARRQVTLTKEVLDHLGLRSGDTVKLDLLPNGRAELTADRPQKSWGEISGCLKGKTNGVVLTI